MAEQPAAEIQLLRSLKAKLIDILSSDADYILQHADSRSLLSPHGYQHVKACRVPHEKVTELLDRIILRGTEAAQLLLELLKDPDLQETFPRLHFIKDFQVNAPLSGETNKQGAGKRHHTPDLQEPVPIKQTKGCPLVTEKQLMIVARSVGKSWREIGRMSLDIPSVKLEQIEEDHTTHRERVFAMLRYWKTCRRQNATAARLHSLLSEGELALPAESLEVLSETI
ncbi:uncharacterized protein zgc:174906 [Betta splendens]|uniref:Uncharacterized protein zgc:174906 n=1 Tax=Betta splendens TaxID=158456 RepID=A0A6P7N4B6_BETSP|nr:uncharacterized protein zgc:174906 [Betta splendens]XP_029012740.1 uncharacterized protein zgc:174906 [Betta splendens]